ncbi:hypothetical protein C8R45DRAFT_389650 [Mycena sanguinolenta]|nr:hypothetical protein C8R45DRAFT_389650 [Mycena sanguinolenta]
MLRQAGEFRTVNISGGVGGNGGRGGEHGGGGGVGEGPATHFGVVNADTMHLVIQNHWLDYAPFRPVRVGSSEGASSESSGTSYNDENIYNFHGVKRRREETEHGSDSSLLTHRVEKRRRLNEDGDEIEVIPSRDLKLIREIGSGPGYLFHAGENKGHAVIVKVFNRGPNLTVRRQLESTVALSKGIMHPNLLRLLGISSPSSLSHFIVYENVHWQHAEGPLAMALKTDLQRSITLGLKMVAGLSAGLNHLLVQGVFARPRQMGLKNFDIFLDVDDRFVICVHPRSREEERDTTQFQEGEGDTWIVLNALCNKTLTSANRVLHHEEITRDPVILSLLDVQRPRLAVSENLMATPLLPFGSAASLESIQEELVVPPRREYVWRTMDRGRQSLENIGRKIFLDLDRDFSSLSRINQTDGRTPHRCAGYLREEITLATTTLDSAVVAHDTPSASERCLICHEVVDVREEFRCECGDLAPGSRHTIKCQACKFWSHSDCVGNANHEFICRLCASGKAPKARSKRNRSTPISAPSCGPISSSTPLPAPPASAHAAPAPATILLPHNCEEDASTFNSLSDESLDTILSDFSLVVRSGDISTRNRRLSEIIDLCLATRRLDMCRMVLFMTVPRDQRTDWVPDLVSPFYIPNLRRTLHDHSIEVYHKPFIDFFRAAIGCYLQHVLGSFSGELRRICGSCNVCAALDEFMVSPKLTQAHFVGARTHTNHLQTHLMSATDIVSFYSVSDTVVPGGKMLAVHKIQDVETDPSWRARKNRAIEFLHSIGEMPIIDRILGRRYNDALLALDGKSHFIHLENGSRAGNQSPTRRLAIHHLVQGRWTATSLADGN